MPKGNGRASFQDFGASSFHVAGIATFASPRVLLPLRLGRLAGIRRGHLALGGLGVPIGFSLVVVALGVGVVSFAGALASYRDMLRPVAGCVMLLLGLQLSGIVRFASLDHELKPLLARVLSPRGFLGGLLYLRACAPCVILRPLAALGHFVELGTCCCLRDLADVSSERVG